MKSQELERRLDIWEMKKIQRLTGISPSSFISATAVRGLEKLAAEQCFCVRRSGVCFATCPRSGLSQMNKSPEFLQSQRLLEQG